MLGRPGLLHQFVAALNQVPHTHTCVHIHDMQIFIHTYIHIYLNTSYMHTCIHTYIHTYIYVHAYMYNAYMRRYICMYNFQSQVDVAKDRESAWNLFWDVILLFWHVIFSFVLKCMYDSFFIFSTSSFFCVEFWKILYLYFLHIILLLC